jgi:WD40 repeat protein
MKGVRLMKTTFVAKAVLLFSLTAALPIVCLMESCRLAAGQHPHALLQIHGMHEFRASHTATVLRDGRVLVAGGFKKSPDGRNQIYFQTAELFDPKSQTFIQTGNMNVHRAGHTATLLPDGRVLIAGGFTEKGMTASAEIYNPSNRTFTLLASMSNPRGDFTATLLPDGNVLLVGGGSVTATPSAELFHPATNRFSPTGSLKTPRLNHTATLLPNGKVLVIGGSNDRTVLASAELYDPGTGVFTQAGTMTTERHKHAAALLKDGHVLIMGGANEQDWHGKYNSAEIYDWRSGRFTSISDMVSQHFKFPASVVQFSGGNVLICGGCSTIEKFNFLTKSFALAATLDQPYYYATASLINDHEVLILGGYTEKLQSTDNAWIYTE